MVFAVALPVELLLLFPLFPVLLLELELFAVPPFDAGGVTEAELPEPELLDGLKVLLDVLLFAVLEDAFATLLFTGVSCFVVVAFFLYSFLLFSVFLQCYCENPKILLRESVPDRFRWSCFQMNPQRKQIHRMCLPFLCSLQSHQPYTQPHLIRQFLSFPVLHLCHQ